MSVRAVTGRSGQPKLCAEPVRALSHDVKADVCLAQDGHLTRARLVKDLARLSVLFRVLRVRLRGSQVREDTARETGIKRHALESGNNSVSSEFRAKPGNARVRIRSIRGFGPHHVQIGNGAIQPIIELFV